MLSKDVHPTDQDLLLVADGELPSRRAAQVRNHLVVCGNCRARMAEFEATIADFVRASRQEADSKLSHRAGARALLRARLSELREGSHSSRWRLRLVLNKRRLAYAFAMALLIALGCGIVQQQTTRREGADLRSAYAGPLPNPSLTPGSTRPVTFAELCSEDHDEVVRAVPTRLQQEVFQEYGIAGAPTADYELDYLITPGLGGSDDIRNLWPEPHHNTAWNSYVKDQLEDRLHHLVCGGKLTLATAQQEMASNWVLAYKKYFHSDRPLPNEPAPTVSSAFGLNPGDRRPTVCRRRSYCVSKLGTNGREQIAQFVLS